MARIAVNARFLLPDKMEGFGWFTHEVVSRIVHSHPEHEFYLFFDRSFDKRFVYASNVIPIVLSPPARHPWLFYVWFEISVKRALAKYEIDVFLSPDGYLCSGTKVPQIAVIHDLNFEHYPQDLPAQARKYLKKWFPVFASKAAHIVTVSEFSKNDISETYGIDAKNITVAWNGVNDAYKPLPSEQKMQLRTELTGGKPYFVYVGSLHPRKNIIRMLQAYDAYRDSGGEYAMVIAGGAYWWNKKMDADFKKLKHGHEVVFTGHLPLERLTRVVAGANAMVYVSYFEGFGIPLVEAMRCGVPVIAANATSLPEVGGTAALYCDPFNIQDITNAMIRMSNDLGLRQELSDKGLRRSSLFSWDKTAEKVWEVVADALP